nr:MAG: hypothetical protein [Triatovirus sp.]
MQSFYHKVNMKKMVGDLLFVRDHPIYDDWKNWQNIVLRYNSCRVRKMEHAINRGKGYHSFDYHLSDYELSFTESIRCRKESIQCLIQQGAKWITFFEEAPKLLGESCSCFLEQNSPFKLADYSLNSLQVNLIALLWAFVTVEHPRKYYRKYYMRLQRVILSLDQDLLSRFDPNLILNPPEVLKRGQNLLREVYRRAYFDQSNPLQMAQRFEFLKHMIPKQQSGSPSQSVESVGLFPSELFVLAREVLPTCTNGDVQRWMSVRQQSVFSVDHALSFKDESLNKIRDLITETQATFLSSLQDTILQTGKNLMIMFATAGTVSLLVQASMTIGGRIIMKLLNLFYSILFGPSERTILERASRICEQSGENITIPFLPSMILNHVISPSPEVLSKIWRNPNIDTLMRRIGYLGDIKVERGLERILDWTRVVIQKVQLWFCRDILGLEVPDDISGESHAIIKWNEEVDALVKSYYDGSFTWTETSWSILHNLYARGLTFTRTQAYVKWKNDVWKLVNQLGNILEKFKSHQRSGQTIRNPPVTIYLTGDTGVGKSSVTYPLAAEVLKGIFAKEESPIDLKKYWKSLIYMRSAEQEFWDGYENQLVTVFDDFNQQIDSASNPNLELFEIIRASNCFPYPLHMASLDQKANTSFTSKIILVSSNLEKPKTASLNFPAALARRFDICIRVSRLPEYRFSKLKVFNPNIYQFERYDMLTGKTLGYITYKELITLSTDEYFGRRDFVNSIDAYIEKALSKPILDVDRARNKGIEEQVGEWQNPADDKGYDTTDYFWDATYTSFDKNEAQSHFRDMKVSIPFEQGGKVTFVNSWDQVGFTYKRYPRLEPLYRPDFIGSILSSYSATKYAISYVLSKTVPWLREHVVNDPWEKLKLYGEVLRTKYAEIELSWLVFKQKHPYLAKSLVIVSLIFTGMLFLRVFSSFTKKDSKSFVTEAEFAQRTPRSVKSEAYNLVNVPKVKAEAYTPTQVRPVRAEAYGAVKVPVAKVEAGIKEQGVKDLNAAEILIKIARRNLYKMFETTTGAPIGHVFFLRGKICVMPKHYIVALRQSLKNDPEACVYFKAVLLNRAFECRISDLLRSRVDYQSPDEDEGPVISRDLMACSVNTSIVHPDAVPFFCSRDSLSRVDSTEIVLPVMVQNNLANSDRAVMVLRFRKGRSALQRVESLPIGNDESELVRYVRDAWRYEADTEPTECGSPLIVRNTRIFPGKICGFHIAGLQGTGEGFATPFYEDDARAIINMFPADVGFIQHQRLNLAEFPTEQGQVPENAEFLRHGVLEKPVAQPAATKIEPSLCYATYKQPETQPTLLRPKEIEGKLFDPRQYRLGRLGNVPVAIQEDLIANSRDAFVSEIKNVLASSSEGQNANIKAVYTFEEAVCGIDGELYVNSIKRGTSPGFPFIQRKGQTKRSDFFGSSEIYDLETPAARQLKKDVMSIIEAAKRGEVMDHYFVDTLKDERKPIHKAHKTRLFSAGPIDYLIACKMYFNGPVALLQKNRNLSHISVGTNPYSEDWGQIVRVLQEKSKKMVAGDFEGFDASQHQLLLEASGDVFLEISRTFLGATEEDLRIMRVLLVSLFNSFHITGREVYQWTHSLPSGHYLTAPINSVFVNLAFGCIWQLCFKDISYLMARLFWDECGIVAYGDDHVLSVPSSRAGFFNQLTIPELFKKIGLSYTMEDKDAEAVYPTRKITEVSYLKRTFSKDKESGRWLAPLSLGTVLETPMWMHKNPDPRNQTIENIEWALKELSLHNREIWLEWSPKLTEQQELLGYYTRFINQDETRQVCLAQDVMM